MALPSQMYLNPGGVAASKRSCNRVRARREKVGLDVEDHFGPLNTSSAEERSMHAASGNLEVLVPTRR